ncbi:hypothetical protein ACFWNK_09270 [Streptomyces sp. NPDC058417]|uniref:hypothetical protein n=1 Tax=unclassified Streptomyces TaxID=2593676 RepID=UPI003659FB15
MLTSPTPSPTPSTVPSTVWLTRGRHTGPTAPDVLRGHLASLKADGRLQDFLEVPEADTAGELVLEARWRVPGDVTVRARLTLGEWSGRGQEWTLVAEAEQPWDPRWPSPAAMFWPGEADTPWGHETAGGGRFLDISPLPADEKDLRRALRDAQRDGWAIHVVVHEAMTPDERGRRPLVALLPEALHHRVVEHRAAPHQLRTVNWALRDFDVELPRGGALVLPGSPAPEGYESGDFSVRSVFLDGTHPTELLDTITRFAALPRPLPEGGAAALGALRDEWRLLTLEEELARERSLVAMYKEALEAMTQARDLYREAAEQAHEALAVYREAAAETSADTARQGSTKPSKAAKQSGSPFQQFGRTLDRLRETAKGLRPASGSPEPPRPPDASDASEGAGLPEQRQAAEGHAETTGR